MTRRENGQTSTRSFITREFEKAAKERKQMKAEIACALPGRKVDWNTIDWRIAHRNVNRLQARIVKATQQGRWGRVKALQRLLTHSYSGKILAVRRVTENQGKRTPGVDKEIWDTPAKKSAGVQQLRRRGYQPQPLRRVYIPKTSNPAKLRPLGIPTILDRAMQALYLQGLEPVAETTADPNSYGFRKERNTADAIGQCFNILGHRQHAPDWILEGDINACFDKISHDWLLAHIPMDKTILRQWLKAGYIEKEVFHPIETGTPQGGIISPVLANLALDGLEKELNAAYQPKDPNQMRRGVHLVRYADDWIVTGRSKDILEKQILPHIAGFLEERGLELSAKKTQITHISEGFDFLGQNVRKYNGKLIIKPDKKNLKAYLTKVRKIIQTNKTITTGNLIVRLNPIIRGWANYHCHVCSKQTFHYADFATYKALWQWACRRHPRKSARWIRMKYFKTVGDRHWVFTGQVERQNGELQTMHLLSATYTPIRRHVKIRAAANPYDPQWEEYFETRCQNKMMSSLKENQKLLSLLNSQRGHCSLCGQLITLETGWHVHHIVWRSKGGNENRSNLQLLHPTCHRQVHSQR